jgi:hypothetical protein
MQQVGQMMEFFNDPGIWKPWYLEQSILNIRSLYRLLQAHIILSAKCLIIFWANGANGKYVTLMPFIVMG